MVGRRRSSRIQLKIASESEASDINTDDDETSSVTSTSSAKKTRRRSIKTPSSTSKTKVSSKERIPPTVEEGNEEIANCSPVITDNNAQEAESPPRPTVKDSTTKKVKNSARKSVGRTLKAETNLVKSARKKIIQEDYISEEKPIEKTITGGQDDAEEPFPVVDDKIKSDEAAKKGQNELFVPISLDKTKSKKVKKAAKINSPAKHVISNSKPRFQIDYSKYENVRGKDTRLSLLSSELKNNLPFKNFLSQIKNKGQSDLTAAPVGDVFGLDGVQLNGPDTEEPKIQCTLSTQSASTSVAVKNAAEKSVKDLMKKSVLPEDMEKEKNCPKFHESKLAKLKDRKRKAGETAGPGWYNLPRTEITDEIKRDLQVIKMRGALDTKHHYKRSDSKKFPKFFQMGTVVEGAHEFYSSRVSKKARKGTMVDELLADAEFRKKNKKRMVEYEMKKQSGGKGYYKKKMEKRGKTVFART